MFELNLDFEDINDFVKMVIGNLRHYNAYHTIVDFQKHFKELKRVYL